MKFTGIIRGAWCRHLNGEDTSKEMVCDVVYDTEDTDGEFETWSLMHFPVDFSTAIGDHNELVGKKFIVTIA